MISELKVMKSAAGYYIGTEYLEGDTSQEPVAGELNGYWVPNSRDSEEYYRTREEAQHALDTHTYTVRLWA